MIKFNMPLSTKSTAFDKINVDKIGTGGHFTEGSFSSKKSSGLKGQLGKLRRSGKHTSTANISKKNAKQMYELVSGRLKSKAINSKIGINVQDKKKIMHEANLLTKEKGSDFSKEDVKDLEKVVDRLKNMGKDNVLSRGREQNNIVESGVNPVKSESIQRDIDLVYSSDKVNSATPPLYSKGNKTSSSRVINKSKSDINIKELKQYKKDVELPDPAEVEDLPI